MPDDDEELDDVDVAAPELEELADAELAAPPPTDVVLLEDWATLAPAPPAPAAPEDAPLEQPNNNAALSRSDVLNNPVAVNVVVVRIGSP
jgi:hypothetical protein